MANLDFTTRKICTKRNVIGIIVVVWTYAALLPLPAYIGVNFFVVLACHSPVLDGTY